MITVTFEMDADGKYHTYTYYGDDIATRPMVKFMEHIGEACNTLNEALVPLNGALMQANRVITDKEDLNARKV
jgi:hypothetical protein